MINLSIVNLAAYKFVTLNHVELLSMQNTLKTEGESCDIKGTILLSTEGINLILAGLQKDISKFIVCIKNISEFSDLTCKESFSEAVPFDKLMVRIKEELITMGHPDICPQDHSVPRISPQTLKRWLDEKHEMILLDTRNDYEYAVGTFDKAIQLNIAAFRDFPEALKALPETCKAQPIVTFCTGGIRCEKAGEWMLRQGFKEVYQLDGGILKYFETVGGAHYHGACFVFDKRVTLNTQLQETHCLQCYVCQKQSQQAATEFCPYCHHLRQSQSLS